jgi:hypothetical protein
MASRFRLQFRRSLALVRPSAAAPSLQPDQLAVAGLGGATVPFRELLVLADVALAAGAQPVTKSGD